MPPIPVYVLTGGASRRFGVDKATAIVDGEPWGLHVARRLAGPGDPIVMVGTAPSGGFEDVRRINDPPDVAGPLAGVLAALADRQATYGEGLLVIASCDLVRPERGWLEPLLVRFIDADDNARDPAYYDVASYRAADRWQPFPSVAHTRWLVSLRKQVETGTRSLQAALDNANSASVTWTLAIEGPPQANSREELQAKLNP